MGRNPAYLQVYNKIKGLIQDGTYPASTFLPPESDLEEMFRVSRTTVRRAIKMLSDDGIITVRQGSGTIVNGNRTTQNFNRVNSITESLKRKGYNYSTTYIKEINFVSVIESITFSFFQKSFNYFLNYFHNE